MNASELAAIDAEVNKLFGNDPYFSKAVGGCKPLVKSRLSGSPVTIPSERAVRPLSTRLKEALAPDRVHRLGGTYDVEATTEAAALAQAKEYGLGKTPFTTRPQAKRKILRGKRGSLSRSGSVRTGKLHLIEDNR